MSLLTAPKSDHIEKPRGFELRMAFLFASIFAPLGVHVPYLPVWLEANGFSADQIAIILSAPLFLRVATTPFITAAADRSSDRANVLILLAIATVTVCCGYFLPPVYVTVLTFSLALAVVWTPQMPLADSLALSGVRRFRSSYPALRIWGSLSYLLASLVGGFMLSAFGPAIVPGLLVIGMASALLAALVAPRLGRPRVASPLSATDLEKAAPKIMTRPFVMFVAGAGLVMASHGFMNGFVSIYWHSIGVGGPLIGTLWAWSVAAEVCMFLGFARLFSKTPAARVVAVAAIGAMLRWTLFPLIWPLGLGIPGFFAVQTLHALSTALILIGLQKLIADMVPDSRTGAAQGIAFFANGFFTAAVTLVSGPLYARLGVDGFYAMTGVAAAGLLLVTLARPSAPEARVKRHDG